MGIAFKKPSFAAGEISPRTSDRDDAERYHIGLAKCRNWIVFKEGGAGKRPGLRYLGRTKYPDKTTIGVRLERDSLTTYTLEIGDLYFRVWKDRVNVLQLDSVDDATKLQLIDTDYVWMPSAMGVDTWYLVSSHDGPAEIFGKPTSLDRHFPAGSPVVLGEVSDAAALAVDEWAWGDVDSLGFDTIYLRDPNDPNDHVVNLYRYVIPGPLEVALPYLESEVRSLVVYRSSSVLFITSAGHPFARINRNGDQDWEYEVVDFTSGEAGPESYDFDSAYPKSNPPGNDDWVTQYAVTRLADTGVESKIRLHALFSPDPPDPATPPPVGDLGPVWPIITYPQGHENNIIIDATNQDVHWLDQRTYQDGAAQGGHWASTGRAWFLAKGDSGLNGYLNGDIAQDPDVFSGVQQTSMIGMYDITDPMDIVLLSRWQIRGDELAPISHDFRGRDDRGNWCHGFSYEIVNIGWDLPWAFILMFGGIVGFTDPNNRVFELRMEQHAGYNVYRRHAASHGVDGSSRSAAWLPWGRLAAVDARGGTMLETLVIPPYPTEDYELSRCMGSYHDTGVITPDSTREPPSDVAKFNAADRYPSAIAFLGQRMVLASTNEKPNSLWLSVAGEFFDFDQADLAEDDDPIQRDLTTANRIKYMLETGQGSMLVFTTGDEWRVWGEGGPVTPSTINSAWGSDNGIADIAPLRVGDLALYVTQLGREVNSVEFNLGDESKWTDLGFE